MNSAINGSTRAQKEAPSDTVEEEMKSFCCVRPLTDFWALWQGTS